MICVCQGLPSGLTWAFQWSSKGLPKAFQRPSKNPPKGRTMAKQGPYNYIPRTLRASYKGNRSLHGDVVLSSLVLPQDQAREFEKILCVFHAAAVPRTHMQRHCRVGKKYRNSKNACSGSAAHSACVRCFFLDFFWGGHCHV